MIQFKKWTMDWNGEFSRRRIKVIKKYLKNCPRSLAIRERQIKFWGGGLFYPNQKGQDQQNNQQMQEGIWGEENLHSLGVQSAAATRNINSRILYK